MDLRTEKNDFFRTSQVVIILFYTIFVGMHVVITFLFGWEKWILLPILAAVVASWALYIGSVFRPNQRIWLIASFMMVTFFIYGTHSTSTYDLAIVMASLMVLFITAGIKGTIILCLVTYYITMTYDVVKLAMAGNEFDSLVIARTIMHYFVMAMIAWFCINTVNKWKQVMDASTEEIDNLQESTERLNDFLANVSHEIRTPVNAIIGLTGICIDKEKDPEIEKSLISVRSAGRKVANQIGDILDYSEIDRKNAVKNCEDYMMSSMMNDLMTDIREMLKDEVELIIDIDSRIPAVMNTDVTKLKKIILALVSNGIKYTHSGGVYLYITSEQQPYGVNLLIEVTDTGVGMSDEEMERVKERFYQSDSGRSRQSGGLGLGLAIVAGFVEILGGFMTISSHEGEGTTVRVSLPQTVVDDACCMSVASGKKIVLASFMHYDNPEKPVVREYYNTQALNISRGLGMEVIRIESAEQLNKAAEEQGITHLIIGEKEYRSHSDLLEKLTDKMKIYLLGGTDETIPAGSRLKRLEKPFYAFPVVSIVNADEESENAGKGNMKLFGVRALVVDDEPMNLVVAKSIFKRYEMVVDTAASGREAVECCRRKGYDIIFMDHMMAGMDGVEAMKKIRSDVKGVNHETPMVALTANAMSSAKQMFLSEGFDGFVSKPVETEELERTIRKVLPRNLISYTEEDVETEFLPVSSDKRSDDGKERSAADTISDEKSGNGEDYTLIQKQLEEGGADTRSALRYFSDDWELYSRLLIQFAQGADERIGKLNDFWEKKDFKNYEILIHATKSNSKMIGFMDLSGTAEQLERAAHDLDEGYIRNNHESAIEKCVKTAGVISAVFGLGKKKDSAPDNKADDEVLEFGASGADEEVLEFGASGEEEDVLEFGASGEEEDVLEFGASGADDDAIEFGASGTEEGAIEFGASGADDDVTEFGVSGTNDEVPGIGTGASEDGVSEYDAAAEKDGKGGDRQ